MEVKIKYVVKKSLSPAVGKYKPPLVHVSTNAPAMGSALGSVVGLEVGFIECSVMGSKVSSNMGFIVDLFVGAVVCSVVSSEVGLEVGSERSGLESGPHRGLGS